MNYSSYISLLNSSLVLFEQEYVLWEMPVGTNRDVFKSEKCFQGENLKIFSEGGICDEMGVELGLKRNNQYVPLYYHGQIS